MLVYPGCRLNSDYPLIIKIRVKKLCPVLQLFNVYGRKALIICLKMPIGYVTIGPFSSPMNGNLDGRRNAVGNSAFKVLELYKNSC